MDTQREIENRIDDTMASLDHIRRASAPPFLYTRVQALLAEEEKHFGFILLQWLMRPAVAYLLTLLILLLNLWVIWDASSPESSAGQAYAVEYGITPSQDDLIYALNPEEHP